MAALFKDNDDDLGMMGNNRVFKILLLNGHLRASFGKTHCIYRIPVSKLGEMFLWLHSYGTECTPEIRLS